MCSDVDEASDFVGVVGEGAAVDTGSELLSTDNRLVRSEASSVEVVMALSSRALSEPGCSFVGVVGWVRVGGGVCVRGCGCGT